MTPSPVLAPWRSGLWALIVLGVVLSAGCRPSAAVPFSIESVPSQAHVGDVLALRARRASEDVTAVVEWKSLDGAILRSVEGQGGAFSAVAPGRTRLSAVLNGETSSVTVTVSPVVGASSGPLRLSRDNPRYFEDGSGKAVLLTGSHTWANLQDNGVTQVPAEFDYVRWLGNVQAGGGNFFRLWAIEQSRWDSNGPETNNWYAPNVYQRTGPGVALDGLPKFDVNQFNQAYFDRMRQRIEMARERGFYVSVMLFNGFSVARMKLEPGERRNPKFQNAWHGHPFNAANNINGVNGDPSGDDSGEETQELAVPAVTRLQEAYVRKVIDTVNDFDNVLYEIANEAHKDSGPWQYHMIEFLRAYEATKGKQHPVGMTAQWPGGRNETLLASPADWISPNGPIDERPIATGQKVIVADTDHLCGVCGDRAWVWRSFVAGENPLFMDPYDPRSFVAGAPPDLDVNKKEWVEARANLGYVSSLSLRLNLATTRPMPQLASTGLCLADLSAARPAFVVYLPRGGEISLQLGGVANGRVLEVEWLEPATGVLREGAATTGGGSRRLKAPFQGDAVLFVHGV